MNHIQTSPTNQGNEWNRKYKFCWINILNIANLFKHCFLCFFFLNCYGPWFSIARHVREFRRLNYAAMPPD